MWRSEAPGFRREIYFLVLHRNLRGNGSPHITALAGEMERLDPGLPVSLEPKDVDDVEQLGREERDGQVEEAVPKAHGRHQPLHSAWRNSMDPPDAGTERYKKKKIRFYLLTLDLKTSKW